MTGIITSFVGGSYGSRPGAPTIGTATATGATTATVAFTAPADPGSSPITEYTATSSPGGITATSATSPITVSGLTLGTAYTFTVTATNAVGTGPASAASNSVTPIPATWPGVIGSSYQGGFFAGQVTQSSTVYNLVVAPKSSGESSSLQWKTTNTSTAGTSSVIDGPTNSSNMNNADHPAAQFCEGLTIGGYSDWYLPAQNEQEVCYYYLKPSTSSNSTGSGSNANAVSPEPISTNYTTSAPPQTSATNFIAGGSEAYTSSGASTYWTSTERDATRAWTINFVNGQLLGGDTKDSSFRVRAIRRVAA